jgi:hypothetical protein
MVEGIPELQSTHEGICKGCALGKNVKNPFSSNNNRSKEILDLIHSDVSGPMPVKSLGGFLYYVTFVIAQFVARIKDLRFKGQTGITGTNPTQCHHNGMVLSL